MTSAVLVFLGAGIGGALRYGINIALARHTATFPWNTLAINILGSLLMGLLMGLMLKRGLHEPTRLFVGTGVLGGFTTFSAFSLEVATLLDRGAIWPAMSYALGSVVAAVLALYAGFVLARLA